MKKRFNNPWPCAGINSMFWVLCNSLNAVFSCTVGHPQQTFIRYLFLIQKNSTKWVREGEREWWWWKILKHFFLFFFFVELNRRNGWQRKRSQLKIDKYHLTINNVMPINCKLYEENQHMREREIEKRSERKTTHNSQKKWPKRKEKAKTLISFFIFSILK
jgi:hypothetical protein